MVKRLSAKPSLSSQRHDVAWDRGFLLVDFDTVVRDVVVIASAAGHSRRRH